MKNALFYRESVWDMTNEMIRLVQSCLCSLETDDARGGHLLGGKSNLLGFLELDVKVHASHDACDDDENNGELGDAIDPVEYGLVGVPRGDEIKFLLGDPDTLVGLPDGFVVVLPGHFEAFRDCTDPVEGQCLLFQVSKFTSYIDLPEVVSGVDLEVLGGELAPR